MYLNVLMADWSNRNMINLNVGDEVMGTDFKPRQVTEVAMTFGTIYEFTLWSIEPFMLGEENRILLKHKDTDVIKNITVKQFIDNQLVYKNIYLFYGIAPIDIPETQITIPPYFLGLWLGKGTQHELEIEVRDECIAKYLISFAERHRLPIGKVYNSSTNIYTFTTKKRNYLKESLDLLGLVDTKHIPLDYINNSRNIRLLLLAGIIDANGMKNNRYSYTVFFPVIQKQLANDTLRLSRSLGFSSAIQISIKGISTVFIQGHTLTEIPVLTTKKITETPATGKDGYNFRRIITIPRNAYIKIIINGDGHYLSSDFIVLTHDNTLINKKPVVCITSVEKPISLIRYYDVTPPHLIPTIISITKKLDCYREKVIFGNDLSINDVLNTITEPPRIRELLKRMHHVYLFKQQKTLIDNTYFFRIGADVTAYVEDLKELHQYYTTHAQPISRKRITRLPIETQKTHATKEPIIESSSSQSEIQTIDVISNNDEKRDVYQPKRQRKSYDFIPSMPPPTFDYQIFETDIK